MDKSLTDMYGKILTVTLLLALLAGCKHPGEAGKSKEAAMLEYAPMENEVEVMTLALQDFPLQLLSNGKLSAMQKSALYFSESGVISQINFLEGDRVRKGAVIARLEDGSQRRALESARLQYERAKLDYYDVLAGLGYSVSDTLIIPDEVKTIAKIRSGLGAAGIEQERALASLEGTILRAPFSGKISSVAFKTWERTGSAPFCSIIDDSSFEVMFTVLESEYSFLRKGQEVRVSAFAGGNSEARGQIVSIDSSVDALGQIAVRAVIKGGSDLLDGMNVKVIVEKMLSKCLVVPKRAVVVRDGMDVLFRYNSGRAEWVYVNVLDANSESYVVEANASRGSELSEGDIVIVSGNFNLADGSEVVLKR